MEYIVFCSNNEWHWIPTLLGTDALPVVADVVHQWQLYPVNEEDGNSQTIDPETNLLVISPHPDDAALSVGGLLLRAAAKGWQCHIGTLVGCSEYELNPAPGGALVEDISRRRRAEDQHFAELVGATLHQGVALDAPLRHPNLSAFRLPRDIEIAEFEDMIDAMMLKIHPRLLIGPAGIGGHVDHLAARHAVASVAARRHIDVLFYEDLPYSAQDNRHVGWLPRQDQATWLVPIGRE